MSIETVDDYRLPLRQWLCHQVDLKKYTGLEWLDEKKTLVKIPWIQQNHPGWEDTYKLFEAWAIHRDTYTSPPDYKKLKGNFRCALRKSESFQEIKSEYPTIDSPGGDYKIYRVLAAEEVQEKRKEQQSRKRPFTPEKLKRDRSNKKLRPINDDTTKVIIPLGMESGMIKDHQIRSTTPCDNDHRAALARLNHIGAWVPRDIAPDSQWIQIQLQNICWISGVITQGHPRPADFQQWVKTFTLKHSEDGTSWTDVKGPDGNVKVFEGNTDNSTPVTNFLPNPAVARYLRLTPRDYNERPALRMEVIGMHGPTAVSKSDEATPCPSLPQPIPPLAGSDARLQTETIATTLSLIPPSFLQQHYLNSQSLNYLLQNTDHVDMFYLSMADEARKLPPVARLQLQSQIVTLTVDALKRYGKLSFPQL